MRQEELVLQEVEPAVGQHEHLERWPILELGLELFAFKPRKPKFLVDGVKLLPVDVQVEVRLVGHRRLGDDGRDAALGKRLARPDNAVLANLEVTALEDLAPEYLLKAGHEVLGELQSAALFAHSGKADTSKPSSASVCGMSSSSCFETSLPVFSTAQR